MAVGQHRWKLGQVRVELPHDLVPDGPGGVLLLVGRLPHRHDVVGVNLKSYPGFFSKNKQALFRKFGLVGDFLGELDQF